MVTDHGIGACGNQLVALLNRYGAAPVTGEVLARPDGEEKASDGNSGSNTKGPDARRPELAVEPGQRDAGCREKHDHDQEGEEPQDARGGRLLALGSFGTGGLDPPVDNKSDPHHGKERFKEPEHSGPPDVVAVLKELGTKKLEYEKTGDRRDVHQFPFVEKLGSVPSVDFPVLVPSIGFLQRRITSFLLQSD